MQNTPIVTDSLGAAIRRAREAKGLSQRSLSRMAGLSPARLNQIEAGTAKTPGFQSVAKIAAILNVPLDELVRAAGVALRTVGPVEGLYQRRIVEAELNSVKAGLDDLRKRVEDALRAVRTA